MSLGEKIKQDLKRFDFADLVTAYYALYYNMTDVFDDEKSQLILESIKRSTIELDATSSVEEVANYI